MTLARHPDEAIPRESIPSESRWGVWLSLLRRLVNAAQHISGQATFVSAGTVLVTFAEGQPDTEYFLATSGNLNENFWVTSKTVDGFTLNSSNAASVAVVDWTLFR